MAILTRAILLLLLLAPPAAAVRLKDIATIEGVRGNQLSGYGLVMGLDGSGDSQQSLFTVQSVLNLLRRQGVTLNINPRQLQVKNVASVTVSATLPPFARQGSRIDVQVSSLGDAKSLQGGMLYLTPLFGAGLAIALLGETPGLHHGVGLVLIVAGVTIATGKWAG